MISNLASVSPKAQLGNNVTVDSFATICEGVVIGDNCWIAPGVVIFPDTTIGNNCKIFPGAVVGAVSQDLKYKGEKTNTVIGNNTIIREYVTIHKGTTDRITTKIGDNCLLMAYVHIAHDCVIGNNVVLANYVGLSGHITVEDFAIIEGMVGAQQFITVGAHSFIAGGSLIRKSVPPFVRCAREPLSYIGVNKIGLSRRGFSEETIARIDDIYRTLFVTKLSMTKAIEKIESESPDSPEKAQILSFIKNEKDGVIKGI
jgi:UDP-N-acetylglucosamine acyltransferase